jgi:hypothetical protein
MLVPKVPRSRPAPVDPNTWTAPINQGSMPTLMADHPCGPKFKTYLTGLWHKANLGPDIQLSLCGPQRPRIPPDQG